ncbi:hypothetical protein ECG_09178 [Echinococcus granulosus]|nr:hypothetical protein ECG_09175 [Echinococcus granulosus]KAH9278414.1 hypothetical protein ECG_09178 [Echinococcus granulosus]
MATLNLLPFTVVAVLLLAGQPSRNTAGARHCYTRGPVFAAGSGDVRVGGDSILSPAPFYLLNPSRRQCKTPTASSRTDIHALLPLLVIPPIPIKSAVTNQVD